MQGYNPDWSGLLSATAQQAQVLGQLGGLAGKAIADNRAQSQASAQQEQMQSEINSALQSGDPNQIAQVSIKYPKMSQAIRSGFEFKNDATEKNFVDTTSRILSDPENTEKYLNQRIDYLKSIGADPSDTMGRLQMYKDNPANFLKTTEGVFAASYPERYNAYKSSQPKEMTPYQQAQLDADQQKTQFNQGIKKQELEIKRMELEDKKIGRQLQRETNQAKLAELNQKKEANQQKLDQEKSNREEQYLSSMDTMARTIDTAQSILDSDGFSNYFGTNFSLTSPSFAGAFAPGSAGADTSALVDTLKSQGFLSGVQQMKGMGALSDAEGKKISDAIGNLSHTQSESSAKRSINNIIGTIKLGQKRLSDKYGKKTSDYYNVREQGVPQPSDNQSDDDLLNKYLPR
ncbi:phage DNA ejection protein [Vibrio fluvialis]|nr:phage DNA ejection protein [Vibrio fluvialis]